MNKMLSRTIGGCLRTYSNFIFIRYQPFCIHGENMGQGTEYNKWVLARAASHNHNIDYFKRKYAKDRYSIHKLTNLSFMMEIIEMGSKYNLTLNEKIILLAQILHVAEVLGKSLRSYSQPKSLMKEIFEHINFPEDLPCLGTLMSSLATFESFTEHSWQFMVDAILAGKFDEEYDELYGMVHSLRLYRDNLLFENDYHSISQDPIIPQIPIIYRNSLEVLRQYVTHNIYNIKECQRIFESLHLANINEGYFWKSVRDWFNIYTKEQLAKKDMDDFFIMKESCIDKVLYDHGIIRPRPVLQELSSIVYILTEFGYLSWRFIEFAQDLILYAIDHGSSLYNRYTSIAHKEEAQFSAREQSTGPSTLNEHMQLCKEEEEEKMRMQSMERRYRTIFVNPIDVRDKYIIDFLVLLSRSYKKYKKIGSMIGEGEDKGEEKDKGEDKGEEKDKEGQRSFYDKNEQVYMDPRAKKWILIQLVKPEMRYTVKELLQLIECSPFLEDAEINIRKLVTNRLGNLRNLQTSFQELKYMMWFMTGLNFHKMMHLFTYFLVRNHPSEILRMTKLIESSRWVPYLIQYMLRLPSSVNTHDRYFSFEENCYFLLVLLQNAHHWEDSDFDELRIQFEGEMERLKEHIKIVTYSRGFKLSINSNFHKVMEYIDVVEFFEGGNT